MFAGMALREVQLPDFVRLSVAILIAIL
jgi:hypothetical protein